MRMLLCSSASFLLLFGPALAQDQAPSQGGSPMGHGRAMASSPPISMAQHMPEMMQHMRGHEEEEDEHGRERSSRRGAAIRFKRGDVEIAIRCPGSESMRDCVADASTLIDKLTAIPSQQPAAR